MTRRSEALDAIEPFPVASINSADLRALGITPGHPVTIASRRGSVSLYARADDGTPRGSVFIPFCYYEAAANLLTNPVLDPFGKIPEFKYCAVRSPRAARPRRYPATDSGDGCRFDATSALARERHARGSTPATSAMSTGEGMTKSRMEAFSDGVIAVIITILVLELKAPARESLEALTPVIPVFLSY
jgi:formylmethanofuran dehydrogenase subunit D